MTIRRTLPMMAVVAIAVGVALLVRPTGGDESSVYSTAQQSEAKQIPAGNEGQVTSTQSLARTVDRNLNDPISPQEMGLLSFIEAAIYAKQKWLNMTDEEIQRIYKTALAIQEARIAHEASLVRIHEQSADALIVSIPPYPEIGWELRELLHDRLRAEFGPERFEHIDDHLGEAMDREFMGFGTARQVFEIKPPVPTPSGPTFYYYFDVTLIPSANPNRVISNPVTQSWGGSGSVPLEALETSTLGPMRTVINSAFLN